MITHIHNATYEERLSSTITLSILYTLALFCCGLVIFVTYHGKLYQTRVNLLLANVALADFLLSLSNLILQPVNIMADSKWFLCDWTGFVTYVTGLEASWFVPLVVMNRYISIFHSTLFKRIYTTRNIILMIIAGWVFVIFFTLPFHLGGRTGFEWQYQNCGVNTEDSTTWQILVYVLIVAPTFLGNGITGFCNFRIFLKLREHAQSQGSSAMKNNVMSQNKQLMYVTLLHTLFAVCLQSPYILGKLAPKLIEGNVLRQIFPCFYIFNSAINPLSTLYVVKPYRKAVLNLLCCRKQKVDPRIPSMFEPSTRKTMTGTPNRKVAPIGNEKKDNGINNDKDNMVAVD